MLEWEIIQSIYNISGFVWLQKSLRPQLCNLYSTSQNALSCTEWYKCLYMPHNRSLHREYFWIIRTFNCSLNASLCDIVKMRMCHSLDIFLSQKWYSLLPKLCSSNTFLLFLVCLLFRLSIFLPIALMSSGWLVFSQLLMFSFLFWTPWQERPFWSM